MTVSLLVRLRRMSLAFLNLALGVALGLVLLELVLRANPGLLLHGMALLAPIDPPLTSQHFEVHYSDADLFYWIPQLIRPIPPEANNVEAEVNFVTDELGFPNAGPLPQTVDVVVLGRSYSLGAQATDPWPQALAEQTGWRILNLSQTGSNIDTKIAYLKQYGLQRHPRWVVLEVLPSMDIIGYGEPDASLLVQRLPVPIVQFYWRQIQPATSQVPVTPIYPLMVDIPDHQVQLSFFDYYLSALSVDGPTIAASRQWAAYSQQMLALVDAAHTQGACVALLFAPTKSNIYLPLATQPQQLAPAVSQVKTWRLTDSGDLLQDNRASATVGQLVANAFAARDLVEAFAHDHKLVFIDPVPRMTQAALAGQSPFMFYDTHWNAAGHQIVSQVVAEQLHSSACP